MSVQSSLGTCRNISLAFFEGNNAMIDGFPLTFFFPLVVHALAGLTTGILGVVTFSIPKHHDRHQNWGMRYLCTYTLVFFTATLLSVQHWSIDAYLFFLAAIGYGFALSGYGARRFRQQPLVRRMIGKRWVICSHCRNDWVIRCLVDGLLR